jgi:hypothetical protein
MIRVTCARSSSDSDGLVDCMFVKNGKMKYEDRDILMPEPRDQSRSKYGIMQQIYKEMQT